MRSWFHLTILDFLVGGFQFGSLGLGFMRGLHALRPRLCRSQEASESLCLSSSLLRVQLLPGPGLSAEQ